MRASSSRRCDRPRRRRPVGRAVVERHQDGDCRRRPDAGRRRAPRPRCPIRRPRLHAAPVAAASLRPARLWRHARLSGGGGTARPASRLAKHSSGGCCSRWRACGSRADRTRRTRARLRFGLGVSRLFDRARDPSGPVPAPAVIRRAVTSRFIGDDDRPFAASRRAAGAVCHCRLSQPWPTAAAFARRADQTTVEQNCMAMLM